MELAAFGLDTLRVAFTLKSPLPVSDQGYAEVLNLAGWQVHMRPELLESGDHSWAARAFFQDPDLPTFRAGIEAAGRIVWTECSLPAYYNGGRLNLDLSDPREVTGWFHDASAHISRVLPGYSGYDVLRIRKADYAADIRAGDAKPGVLAAASRFKPSRARKVTRGVFPGESTFTSTPQLGFKAYDKALELIEKLRREDPTPRQLEEEEKLQQWVSGLVRMEVSDKPKKGISYDGLLLRSADRYCDVVRDGLRFEQNQGQIYVGGLAQVHAHVQSLDVPPTARARLFKFSYELSTFGEEGTQALYTRATYYRYKKELRDLGVVLEELFDYSGVLDFNPVLDEIRHRYSKPSPRPSYGPTRAVSQPGHLLERVAARLAKLETKARRVYDPERVRLEHFEHPRFKLR